MKLQRHAGPLRFTMPGRANDCGSHRINFLSPGAVAFAVMAPSASSRPAPQQLSRAELQKTRRAPKEGLAGFNAASTILGHLNAGQQGGSDPMPLRNLRDFLVNFGHPDPDVSVSCKVVALDPKDARRAAEAVLATGAREFEWVSTDPLDHF
jgi:hypothetical protein